MCIDLRKLNAVTRRDSYAIPIIADAIDSVGGSESEYFTTLDLRSSYHQIELEEASKEKTAFVTYSELETVPFGTTNAPALLPAGHGTPYERLQLQISHDIHLTTFCAIARPLRTIWNT
jgi:hypothetical protein